MSLGCYWGYKLIKVIYKSNKSGVSSEESGFEFCAEFEVTAGVSCRSIKICGGAVESIKIRLEELIFGEFTHASNLVFRERFECLLVLGAQGVQTFVGVREFDDLKIWNI